MGSEPSKPGACVSTNATQGGNLAIQSQSMISKLPISELPLVSPQIMPMPEGFKPTNDRLACHQGYRTVLYSVHLIWGLLLPSV